MQLRRSAKIFLALMALSVVVSFVISAWLNWTESGKRWVADRIETVVSDEIPGTLRVGHISEIGPPLLAEDVRFFHPDGRLVLLAKRAEVELNMLEAVQGRLGFDRASVVGGQIVLSPDPDGRVAFEAAVDKPSKPGEPSDPTGGLHYALQSMHVEDFEVIFKVSDAADFRLHDVEGFVGVRRIETSGIRITLERIRGRLEPEFLGKRTELSEVTGQIHGKVEHVLRMNTAVRIGSGSLQAKIDYYDREKTPVTIVISKAKGEGDFVAGVLDFADGLLGESIEVKVEGDDD